MMMIMKVFRLFVFCLFLFKVDQRLLLLKMTIKIRLCVFIFGSAFFDNKKLLPTHGQLSETIQVETFNQSGKHKHRHFDI